MAIKLFITGATGYIGGDALSVIVKKYPDWDITCLVRNSDKGAKIASQYASIRLVYGDLDSSELIEEEAFKADIVYHFANCDHEASAVAITKGLARRPSESPAFWIHTSGSAILGIETIQKQAYGEELPKVYNDWDGINELTSFPDDAPHRNVDKIVLAASISHPNIKTAIVCPPTIYGLGRGPDNQKSIQIPLSVEVFLKLQKVVNVGKSENVWHQVHIHDLSQLYLLLGEAAVAGGPPATWNDQGYYLAENGEFRWCHVFQKVATDAYKKSLLPSDKVGSMHAEAEFAAFAERLQRGVGLNSRGVSIRARKLLGWEPKGQPLADTISATVDDEAKKLGLIKGHREKLEEQMK